MKFHIVTYGCQMNVRDTEAVAALLLRHGHERAGAEADAGLVIVNTCSVRGKAEQKALGKLGLLVKTKRDNPERIVGVMGCMAQRLGERATQKVRGLDFAVGTHRLASIPEVVDLVREGRGPVVETAENGEDPEMLSEHAEKGVSTFVNILLGCDRRCTYCIVPSVRGPEWSRPAHKVIDEVKRVVDRGVREVTLLGQSVMSYGRRNAVWSDADDSPMGFTEALPRLLEACDAVDGLRRLRFTSGHASGCTEELARAMADLPTVCEHLHVPCQSGSDRILKKMRRGYTSDQFRQAVERIRHAVPSLSLTTDIIVGFPTETEEDFEQTRSFMDEIGFDNAFVFKYSPRSGTVAAEWDDDVSPEEKLRRNKILLVDQDRRSLAANEQLVGQDVEVLVQGVSLRNQSTWSGRTRTSRIVVFPPWEGVQPGDLATIRIERARPQTLYGASVGGKEA